MCQQGSFYFLTHLGAFVSPAWALARGAAATASTLVLFLTHAGPVWSGSSSWGFWGCLHCSQEGQTCVWPPLSLSSPLLVIVSLC